ncbi:Hypothetical predicted protein [Mytilus galloprovincialis]|uniref:Uncharacterized protein n=1 Tax=Mytilus galloprovincialis TaxID=29158 RepID=A0A8B6CQ40_MYTGA|nr:Hypothetical predicted protein [Mytilus galloprovincialis]
MEFKDADHVVPDLQKSSKIKSIRLPRRSKASSKLRDYNNDFFNLYNDSVCSDSYNVSDSNSSIDEARMVPIGIPSTHQCKKYDDTIMTYDFCASDGDFDLDINERIVVGCESYTRTETGKSKRNKKSVRKSSCKKVKKDQPQASSTMVESPYQSKHEMKCTLNRKDSGISESITSLQALEVSYDAHVPVNDLTFVICSNNDSSTDEDDVCNIAAVSDNIQIETVSSISAITQNISRRHEFKENTYLRNSFYNKNKGVPRTSTKARLRLTPKKTEKTRIFTPNYSNESVRPVCSLPFTKLLRLLNKKYKKKQSTNCKIHKPILKTDMEREEIMMRMRYFKESFSNNTSDLRILANL